MKSGRKIKMQEMNSNGARASSTVTRKSKSKLSHWMTRDTPSSATPSTGTMHGIPDLSPRRWGRPDVSSTTHTTAPKASNCNTMTGTTAKFCHLKKLWGSRKLPMEGFSTKMGLKQWGYLGTIPEEMYLITHNLTESGTPCCLCKWQLTPELTRLNKKSKCKNVQRYGKIL